MVQILSHTSVETFRDQSSEVFLIQIIVCNHRVNADNKARPKLGAVLCCCVGPYLQVSAATCAITRTLGIEQSAH